MTNDRRYALIAPMILVAVAALQFYRVTTAGMTPWKGGGFGMFSTVDSPASRTLRCYIASEDEVFVADVPPGLSRTAGLATNLPSNRSMNALAKALAQKTWVPAEYSYTYLGGKIVAELPLAKADNSHAASLRALSPFEPSPMPGIAIQPKAIRIEVWKTSLDIKTRTLRVSRIRKVTVRV